MHCNLVIWLSFAAFTAMFIGAMVAWHWPRKRPKLPNPFAHLDHMADLSGLRGGGASARQSGICHDRPRIAPDGGGMSGGGMSGGGGDSGSGGEC